MHAFVYWRAFATSAVKTALARSTHNPLPSESILAGHSGHSARTKSSGLPFTVTDQTAVAGVIGLSAERPNLVRSDIRVSDPTVGSAGRFLDISAFSLPAPYTLGNAPRNVGAGPNQSIISGSLFKVFPIRERLNLQFRTECFNVANHPFFGNPNTSFGNANFGKMTSTAGGYTPRQLQFALKLQF